MIIDGVNHQRKNNYVNQMDFFGEIEPIGQSSIKIEKSGRVPTSRELLDMEKEMLGLYISGHPLDEYKEYVKKNATVTTLELNEEAQSEDEEDNSNTEPKQSYDEKTVTLCGIFNKGRVLVTKAGKNMMFAGLEDLYGEVELVIFPTTYDRFFRILEDEAILKVTGKVTIKEDEGAKILVQNIVNIDEELKRGKTSNIKEEKAEESKVELRKIYIRIPKDKLDLEDRVIGYIKDLNKEYPGKNPVYIFYDGTNKMRLLPSNHFLQDNSLVIEKLELAFGKENIKIK